MLRQPHTPTATPPRSHHHNALTPSQLHFDSSHRACVPLRTPSLLCALRGRRPRRWRLYFFGSGFHTHPRVVATLLPSLSPTGDACSAGGVSESAGRRCFGRWPWQLWSCACAHLPPPLWGLNRAGVEARRQVVDHLCLNRHTQGAAHVRKGGDARCTRCAPTTHPRLAAGVPQVHVRIGGLQDMQPPWRWRWRQQTQV
jgi:hypothetical protein